MNQSQIEVSLILACNQQNLPDIDAALAAGADPNCVIESTKIEYSTPMVAAAAVNFLPGLRRLLEAGGNPNLISCHSITPLMIAGIKGHVESGRWLLNNGALANVISKNGYSALRFALSRENYDFANLLTQESSYSKHELSEIASNIIAVEHSTKLAQWLLDAGVSPDQTTKDGDPWLVRAQTYVSQNIVTQMLIEAGANVNAQNKEGHSALHKAVIYQISSNFIRLLRSGANPDIRDQCKSPRSLLHDYLSGAIKTRNDLVSNPQANLEEMNDFLMAWDASKNAHRILQNTAETPRLKPL